MNWYDLEYTRIRIKLPVPYKTAYNFIQYNIDPNKYKFITTQLDDYCIDIQLRYSLEDEYIKSLLRPIIRTLYRLIHKNVEYTLVSIIGFKDNDFISQTFTLRDINETHILDFLGYL